MKLEEQEHCIKAAELQLTIIWEIHQLGRLDEADSYLTPDLAEAHYNLGNTLKRTGLNEDWKLDPGFAEASL